MKTSRLEILTISTTDSLLPHLCVGKPYDSGRIRRLPRNAMLARRLLLVGGLACGIGLGALVESISAQAGVIRIFGSHPEGNLDQWLVTWPDPVNATDPIINIQDTTPNQNPVNSDPTKVPVNPVQTKNLLKTITFKSLAPVTITFEEIATSANNVGGSSAGGRVRLGAADAGLNFILDHDVRNQSIGAFSGYIEKLRDRDRMPKDGGFVDATVPDASGNAAHPAKVHFHTRNDDEFKITKDSQPDPFEALSFVDAGQLLVYGKGLLNPGKDFGFKVRVHDILEKGFRRRFDLDEIPVAEPPTLALLGLGTLCLMLGAVMRRRQFGAQNRGPSAISSQRR